MADLAKLVVRLEMQSAQLQKGLDQANGKLASFEKSVTATLSRIDKRFGKIGGGIKTAIGVLAGAVSFREIVAASADAAKNFALLENAVAQAGEAAGGRTARQFADVSKELQNISTFSDDSIQNVQQLLLRFQNIRTDRFDDATKSVLNLSAAIGQDLDSAAKLLGKSLSDPEKGVTALAKAGVVLSDSQRKVIKDLADTGRSAEAQGILLDALEKKYGGAAAAARNNFSGALQGVKNSLNDLMEVDSGLPGATESLNELGRTLADPGVKAGADALFSILITGAGKAAELIGKTVAGLTIIAGYGQDEAVNLDMQIRAVTESLDALQRRNPFPDKFAANLIAQQTAELKKLNEQYQAVIEARAAAMRGNQGVGGNGAENLPDIVVTDGVSEAAEKARKAIEAQGRALTDKLLTPMQQYDAAVAEADRLLAAHVITTDTWARALGAARAQLDEVSSGILEVSERYKTLEQEIESGRSDLVDSIQADLEKSNDVLLDKFEKQSKEANKKMTVFAEQAARNTQDILADGLRTALHDGLEDGAKGALQAFGAMLQEMALQAIAADIAGKIFGKDGEGGGWLQGIAGAVGGTDSGGGGWGWLSTLASVFGGSRDRGGRGRSGEAVMIGTGAQPELFVPDGPGEFFPVGMYGGKTEINFMIQAPSGRVSLETQQQIAARTAQAIGQAQRRNG